MNWETEMEFGLTQSKGCFFRYPDNPMIKIVENPVNKKFTISNGFLHGLLDGKYGVYSCFIDDNSKWGYISNCMFELIETDYRTAKSLDSAMWLCKVIAYQECE